MNVFFLSQYLHASQDAVSLFKIRTSSYTQCSFHSFSQNRRHGVEFSVNFRNASAIARKSNALMRLSAVRVGISRSLSCNGINK